MMEYKQIANLINLMLIQGSKLTFLLCSTGAPNFKKLGAPVKIQEHPPKIKEHHHYKLYINRFILFKNNTNQHQQSLGLHTSFGQDLKFGLLALWPSSIHLFTEAEASNASKGGPSTLILIRSSTVLGCNEDLMSDFMRFWTENPLSHCAEDTGRINMMLTR